MRHPPAEEIMRGGDAVRAHLRGCPACSRLAGLFGIEVPVEAPPDVTFDKARYVDWSELADGAGGMGRAFRAWDRQIGREVVIKQPLPSASGRDLRARFEHEALLTARLAHPGIVAVYEAGKFGDGEPFYAMPLVRGRSLHDEIARRPAFEERLGLVAHVMAICDAVSYAHDQHVVHRDIKPANVLVGSFGETVLIDWGLAKDLRAGGTDAAIVDAEPRDGLTQVGIGTAQYMPPEQALAERPTARMDVYALGATLYHTLCGRPPYGNVDTASARAALLAGPPAPLDEVVPDVAPALVDIVRRAMAREPADRFQSARELADELRRFQTGQLVHSRRYTPAEIVKHFVRRHRVPVAIGSVAAALLAIVGIISVLRVAHAGQTADRARAQAEANERASELEHLRGMGISASELAFIPAHRLEALALAVRAVAPRVAAHAPPSPEALQGLYDALFAGPPLVVVDDAPASISAIAFSADASLLVTAASADHVVDLWDGHTGKLVRRLTSGGANFTADAIAIAGDRVLTWGRQPPQAQLWSTTGAPAISLAVGGSLAGAGLFADGDAVAAGDALVWFDRSGTERTRVVLARPALALATAPDHVAVLMEGGEVGEWTEHGERTATWHVDGATAIAISRDATRVAVAGAHVLAIAGGDHVRSHAVELTGDSALELAFAPSGRHVLARRGDRAVSLEVAGDTSPVVVNVRDASAISDAGVWTAAPARLDLLDPSSGASMRTFAGDGRVAVATETSLWIIAGGGSDELDGHSSEPSALGEIDGVLLSAGLEGRVRRWGKDGATYALASEPLMMATTGDSAVLGTADGHVVELDAHLAEAATWPSGAGPITAVAASESPRRVVVARIDGEIVLRGDHDVSLQPAGAPVAIAAAFSPDARWLVTAHIDDSLRLWDVERAALVAKTDPSPSGEWNGRAMFALAFDDRGRLYAGRFGRDTAIVAIPSLQTTATLPGHLLALSRDGRFAATRRGDSVLVHALTGTAPPHVLALNRPISAAAFSADSSRLALGNADGVVTLVDPSAPATTLVIPAAGTGAVSALRFLSDGRSLAVAHASGVIRIHPVRADDALADACARLSRFGIAEASCH